MILGSDVLMIATDLDGTLLRRDGTVSERTIKAVHAAAKSGAIVVLVTARPPRWVKPIAAQLSCHPLAICSNGALIYDATSGVLVAEHPIDPSIAAEVVERLRAELEGVVFAVEAGLRYGQEPTYNAQWPVPPGALIQEAERLIANPIAKLIVRHAEPGDHWALVERARHAVGGLVEVSSSGPDAPIEVAAPGVSKAFALELIANEHDIDATAVLACGDMPNDLPMLAWAGHSAAPANAHPEVLAIVDHVAGDCDADGIAVLLEGLTPSSTTP